MSLTAEIAAQLAGLIKSPSVPAFTSIAHDEELDRICRIPRREQWTRDDPTIWQLVFELSAFLRLPGSNATLRPVQAVALAELWRYGRLLGPIPVGRGKTLITFLAAVILQRLRPVLVIPANLKGKTERAFEALAKQWRSPASMQMFTYEQLSRDYRVPSLLELSGMDLFMRDESHRLKNPRAACTQKVDWFLAVHPELPNADLSGSMTRASVKDYVHIAHWTLQEYSPLPRSYHKIRDWAAALDVRVRDEDRVHVGALLEFATEKERKELDPLTAARRGFRRRLLETPGVVAFDEAEELSSLLIREAPEPDYGPETEDALYMLREKQRLPDGTETFGGVDDWRHERTLVRDFYQVYDPPPPEPWKNARADWYAAARQVLKFSSRVRINSEFQVANACANWTGRHTGDAWKEAKRAYDAWRAIRDSFKPRTVAHWIGDAALKVAAKWLDENAGILWVEHVEFAERLSSLTGRRYYHESGFAADGLYIEDSSPARDGSIIASIDSNKQGRNLQYAWALNFFLNLPKGGDNCEQALGRTHRSGQPEDQVIAEMAIWCAADWSAWEKILADSRYMTDSMLGAKVSYCDKFMPDEFEIAERAQDTWRFAAGKRGE